MQCSVNFWCIATWPRPPHFRAPFLSFYRTVPSSPLAPGPGWALLEHREGVKEGVVSCVSLCFPLIPASAQICRQHSQIWACPDGFRRPELSLKLWTSPYHYIMRLWTSPSISGSLFSIRGMKDETLTATRFPSLWLCLILLSRAVVGRIFISNTPALSTSLGIQSRFPWDLLNLSSYPQGLNFSLPLPSSGSSTVFSEGAEADTGIPTLSSPHTNVSRLHRQQRPLENFKRGSFKDK